MSEREKSLKIKILVWGVAAALIAGTWASVRVQASEAGPDVSVLKVIGRGTRSKDKPYRGGGKIRFLDVQATCQVVDYRPPRQNVSGKRVRVPIPLPLKISYEVLEPAPVVLTSPFGSEYWRLYSYSSETTCSLYASDQFNLSRKGRYEAEITSGRIDTHYGQLPSPGLVSITGHYYFLIQPVGKPSSDWLDVTPPPLFFNQKNIVRKLTFTLADLSSFSLRFADFQSAWRPGGVFRVRLTVKDGSGKEWPVVNVPVVASFGEGFPQTTLQTEWGPLNEPTGWLRGRLPKGKTVPKKISLSATVCLATQKGKVKRRVEAVFAQGVGLTSPEQLASATRFSFHLPRDSKGRIRETRGIWISTRNFETQEQIDNLIRRCKQARLNVLFPDVFVRNHFAARSPLFPKRAENMSFDPLAALIKKAHAAGLEVHPWFCVTYRDASFRRWFQQTHGVNIDMLNRDGSVRPFGADVHKAAYRDFMVKLMVQIARDYPVDGIHLDYIRSMGQCFCPTCRAEFQREFGKPLEKATDEEWQRWQRAAIRDIVRRTAEGVRQVRPQAKMSAAVFRDMPSGALQGQDPAGWARAGWLDIVIPMDYQMESTSVRATERQFLEALDDDNKLVTGLSLYMRAGDQVYSRPAELVEEQIGLVRWMGIHGYCLFAFNHLSDEQLKVLREKVNKEPAVPYFRSSR